MTTLDQTAPAPASGSGNAANSGSLFTAPRTILLFRHAEKPTVAGDPHLSPAGSQRAATLATYIPNTFGQPDFIIAAANSHNSERPYETVQPLSQATGLPIDATIKDGDFQLRATDLLTNKQYAGKLVVLCWHHGMIPALAAQLNAPAGSYPQQWNGTVFNLILKLDFQANSQTPTVTQVTEPF